MRRGKNRSTQRKTSRSREENQQQTQPTYDAGSGNRIQNTLAGGERSQGILLPELINQIFKKDCVILPVIKTYDINNRMYIPYEVM